MRRLFFLPKNNSASKMCAWLNITYFEELAKKSNYSFRLRLSISVNSVIDNIFMSLVHIYSNIWA